MLERMTARQLRNWLAFHDLDPWTPHRDDMRLAVVIQAILAPWANNSPDLPPPFYPYRDNNEPETAPDAPAADQLEWLRANVDKLCPTQ